MAETAAELIVDVSAKESVSAVLARLESQLDRTDGSAQKTADGIGARLNGAQQRAGNSALALQQAQARLEVAQGNAAGAAERLRTALAQQSTTSVQTINAQRQLVSVENQLAQSSSGLGNALRTAGSSAQSSLLGMVGPAAAATAGITALIGVAQSFEDAFKFKATLDSTTASIRSQLDGVRDANAVYAQAQAFGRQYNITQEETNNILSSSTDILKTSSSSVSELETALIRLQSRDVSKPISEASRALRELQAGDVTSIKELFNVPAKDALAMRNEIVAGGDAVKVLTGYLDRAGVGMQALELRSQGVAGRLNELKIAQEDLTLAQAEFAQGPGLTILEGKIAVIRGATRLLSGDLDAMGQSLNNAGVTMAGQIAAYQAYSQALAVGKTQSEANRAAVDAQANAMARLRGELVGGGGGTFEFAAATQQATTAVLDSTAAQLAQANSMELSGVQARAAALAAQQKADADQVAAVDAQTNGIAQQRLAEQAQQAAQALLNAGPAGARTAALLASSSSQVDVLTAAYYRLAAAQAEANQAKTNAAALSDQRAGERDGGSSRTAAQIAFEAQQDRRAQASRLRRAEEAERALKKARGGGGGGGGSTQLSDQTKLNNSLLADQERYQDKSEDAARQHAERILDIQAEFARKEREQLQQNEISKRQSQADFYDRLTSSELNKRKGGTDALKQIDADYQAAYQKSQELAQSGNAKLAADYLALKQRQAEQELSYQEAVAKAREDKDAAEVGRLERIQQLRRDAAAEEERQLLAGGDANVTARDSALNDEATSYAQKQDQVGLASDRATDRKIANAERAGKAIDAEQLKLNTLAQTYDRIAPPQAGGPLGAASTPTPVAAPAAPGQPQQQAASLGDVVAAIGAAQAALSAALGQVERATRDAGRGVESAVRSIPRSVQ